MLNAHHHPSARNCGETPLHFLPGRVHLLRGNPVVRRGKDKKAHLTSQVMRPRGVCGSCADSPAGPVITGAGLDPSSAPAGIPSNGSDGEGCWGEETAGANAVVGVDVGRAVAREESAAKLERVAMGEVGAPARGGRRRSSARSALSTTRACCNGSGRSAKRAPCVRKEVRSV